MIATTQQKLDRITRISAALRILCTVLLVLAAALTLVACAAVMVGGDVTLQFFDVRIPVENLTTIARLALVGLVLVSMGVVFKALVNLKRLFGIYADGKIFTPQAAANIRQLGILTVIWAAVCAAWEVTPHFFAPATVPLLFHLRIDLVIVGVVIVVISWFMQAAAELQAENDLTI
jgi:hypothetical protein